MFVRNFFDTIQTERAEPCSEGTEQTERGRGVDNREIINETLVHLFHEIQKLEEEAIITEDFKDLTNNDMHIIEAVGLEGGNMSSIAAKLDITVGSLTTSMNSLVKKGYTERERSEKDRRIVYIHLTGKGRQAFHHHAKFHEQMTDAVMAELGEEEVQVGYLRTGIGKVKSAFYLAEAISSAQPDLVVNVGTAGTVRHQVGDILVCRHFIDRDMQRLTGFDMECEIDSSELLEQKGYCLHWQGEGVCNTGDTFLTELSDVKGDVVDMEAYAQALVCRAKNTPFIAVKYVTDIIGQNSVKHWEDKLADARKGLGEFLEALGGVV